MRPGWEAHGPGRAGAVLVQSPGVRGLPQGHLEVVLTFGLLESKKKKKQPKSQFLLRVPS